MARGGSSPGAHGGAGTVYLQVYCLYRYHCLQLQVRYQGHISLFISTGKISLIISTGQISMYIRRDHISFSVPSGQISLSIPNGQISGSIFNVSISNLISDCQILKSISISEFIVLRSKTVFTINVFQCQKERLQSENSLS